MPRRRGRVPGGEPRRELACTRDPLRYFVSVVANRVVLREALVLREAVSDHPRHRSARASGAPRKRVMSISFLVLAVLLLAYSNGANDNFKGVASLFGSNTTTYRTALAWATLTTAAGSLLSIFLAEALLRS